MRVPYSVGSSDDDDSDMSPRTQGIPLPDDSQAEEDLWEDEPEYNLANTKRRSSAALLQKSVRKRKPVGKKISSAQTTPSSRKSKNRDTLKESTEPLINIDRDAVRRGLQDGAAFTWEYVFDIFGTTLRLLRIPFAGLLFLYIFAFLVTQASAAFRTAFSPICWVPFISSSRLCYTAPLKPKVPRWADYPKLVQTESSILEKLLDESVENAGLSLDIKKSEMATSDLVTLVKFSELKSKDQLVEHLETFIDDSKKTGRALQRLGSRVNGAVDRYIELSQGPYSLSNGLLA